MENLENMSIDDLMELKKKVEGLIQKRKVPKFNQPYMKKIREVFDERMSKMWLKNTKGVDLSYLNPEFEIEKYLHDKYEANVFFIVDFITGNMKKQQNTNKFHCCKSIETDLENYSNMVNALTELMKKYSGKEAL